MPTTSLAEQIDHTRITYHSVDGVGFTINGSAFIITFNEPVAPEALCETISEPSDPWYTFGIKTPLSSDYWKWRGVLLHVENGEQIGTSKITVEVAEEWARVYVKEGCDEHRAAEFVEQLCDTFNGTVNI